MDTHHTPHVRVAQVGEGGEVGSDAAAVRFSVLGLIGIADRAQTVVFRPSKPVSLLAALLLYPNQALSVEFLQHAVWEGAASATAKATLQTYVLRLRRLFRKFGVSDNLIETVPGGYRFPASAASLDLLEFRELVRGATGHADPDEELRRLHAALALWQGAPLANVQSATLHRDAVPRLEEEWLRAAERCFDLHLELGRHRDLAVELRAATQAHPGHERFREQLMEALYRSGRQADALAEYRSVKGYLREELGVFPGSALQRLETTILRGEQLEPRTGAPAAYATRPDRAAPPPGVRAARPERRDDDPATPVPVPIPPDLPNFVGRDEEVRLLVEQLTGERSGPMVAVVSGPPGIGKTALAVHVAHLVRAHFPGGQWFLSLSDAEAGPSPGGGASAAPMIVGTRNLVVVDDVHDARGLAALLPTDPHSAALVTCRTGLSELLITRGGWAVRLDALPPPDSHRLLTTVLGARRIAADPEAAHELAELCGHFPIALRIVASRLLTGRRQTLSGLVEEVRADPVRGLTLGADRQVSVFALLDEFLTGLDHTVADAFVRIGASTLATFSPRECAERLDCPLEEAEHLLEALLDAGLVESHAGEEYRVNTLLRGFARAASGRRPALLP
ncbi:BTAD domain-containing putative transcriptional regulator [Embleya sp. AB8]|uniref:AfsR/SARP family transcriptional regulator n=1 Tax=Embleya sp. AB8 TaxID=3156304 RepID=UPI003C7790B4